jgi:two-component system, LytTR family, response regulator LytT
MEKRNIFIVEDEIIIAQNIKKALIEFGYHILGTVQSFSDAVKLISQNQPDLAIIDTKLKGKKSGIELGKYIRENFHFPFIFLTSFDDNINFDEVKGCCPEAYLPKHFIDKELHTTIEIAINNYSKLKKAEEVGNCRESIIMKDSIFIKKDSSYIKVKLENIIYVKSEGNYLEVMEDGDKKYIIRITLKDFIKYLPKDLFLRTHNSYVININYIVKITYSDIFLKGYTIPFSRSRRDEVLKKMNFFT